MKYRSSKRSKALDISPEVKERVWQRDNNRCVYCGRYGAYVFPDAHFIPRSKGGLGIEQNVLTLCRMCHDRYDNGDSFERLMMKLRFKEYLSVWYPEIDYDSEEQLIYHKEDF